MHMVKLKYPMNNPSALEGRRGGFVEGGHDRGSILVCGSNAFCLIGVDGVHFSPPYCKVCKGGGVIDVLVFIPINNWVFVKAPV